MQMIKITNQHPLYFMKYIETQGTSR